MAGAVLTGVPVGECATGGALTASVIGTILIMAASTAWAAGAWVAGATAVMVMAIGTAITMV